MLVLALLFAAVSCEIHAVIVSGIFPITMLGYAAEADIYQLTQMGGVKPENIIVFAMDGVSTSSYNPWSPNVYSYPGGPEVYQGVKDHFDYVGNDNNPTTFLDVIQGKDPGCGSHRFLNAGEDDVTFVMTISHGGPGYFIFLTPDGQRHNMQAADLIDAVKNMKGEVVFYFNSCYSGSMFAGKLDKGGKVVAMTGAPPDASAWACCANTTGGRTTYMDSCLHHNWQLDSRQIIAQKAMETTTFNKQHDDIQAERQTKELYCTYGNPDLMDKVVLSDFQGDKEEVNYGARDPECNTAEKFTLEHPFTSKRNSKKNLKLWKLFRTFLELEDYVEPNMNCDNNRIKDVYCQKRIFEAAEKHCGVFAEYEKENAFHFADACNSGKTEEEIVDVLEKLCTGFL